MTVVPEPLNGVVFENTPDLLDRVYDFSATPTEVSSIDRIQRIAELVGVTYANTPVIRCSSNGGGSDGPCEDDRPDTGMLYPRG